MRDLAVLLLHLLANVAGSPVPVTCPVFFGPAEA